MLNGPKGRPIDTPTRMTEKVVLHARYALKLDVPIFHATGNAGSISSLGLSGSGLELSASSRGSIGAMIEPTMVKILTIQDFVTDIGSPQIILDDIERLGTR